jgi:hypothetical protein
MCGPKGVSVATAVKPMICHAIGCPKGKSFPAIAVPAPTRCPCGLGLPAGAGLVRELPYDSFPVSLLTAVEADRCRPSPSTGSH